MTEQLKKPESCVKCKGAEILFIIRGQPSREAMAMVHRGEAVLGGLTFSTDMPHWQCKDCGHQFSIETDPAVKELRELEGPVRKKEKSCSCKCGQNT
jgi:hypothetical protein